MSFMGPVDIGNRGLQHCGVPRMDPVLGFTENSKQAGEVSFCYDKLREAELRRNTWAFATKTVVLRPVDTTSMLVSPAMWSPSTTYFAGSIVSDETGQLWISQAPDNLGNQPQNSLTWAEYFGPMTADLYDATTGYFAGEIVYTAAGDGTNRTYLSLQNDNCDNPATATTYDPTVTYMRDQVVTFSSVAYLSLIDLNINNEPDLAPALFNIATTYAAAARVGASDGVIYTSVGSGNVGHDPTTDGGVHWTNTGVLNPWTTVFVGGTGSLKWLQIGGKEFPAGVALTSLQIIYPLGAGPSSQSSTRNVFRLPANWLREAPQDPKAGTLSYLGSPGNMLANDWTYQGNYIVSSCGGTIIYRFVADTVDVTGFDPMFCEALACSVALAVCEPLTQSGAKMQGIKDDYKRIRGEAIIVDGIEDGAEESPLDDYLACRF